MGKSSVNKEASKARVAFVVPYVGPWPHYARLFFESCRYNPGVDVILVASDPPVGRLPANVHFVHMKSADMLQRLERSVGLQLGSFRWHKLCDFRPFFGLVFADLLEPYEFWGYCDTDMMFGDLSSVLDPQYLAGIDAFSAHNKQFVGHFTILRNREDINRLGFEIPHWKELCLTEKAEHLDEERLHDVFQSHPELRVDLPENLDRELEKSFCRHALTYTFYGKVADMTEGADEVVARWRDGKVFALRPGGIETEVLYIHFMALKHWWHWPLRLRHGESTDGVHYFSRIGYGGVSAVQDLSRVGPRFVYWLQCLLLDTKKLLGKSATYPLSSESVSKLRRFLKV
jgi:hypothetical protein